MREIKVLIADDHSDFRKVVKEFLCNLPHVSVIAEAENGHEAVKKVELHSPDLVLMDISMPQLDGLEATRIIKSNWPKIKVLIATVYDDPMFRKQALEVKADGFILKSTLKPSLEATFAIYNNNKII